jgi:hypothetical protein
MPIANKPKERKILILNMLITSTLLIVCTGKETLSQDFWTLFCYQSAPSGLTREHSKDFQFVETRRS